MAYTAEISRLNPSALIFQVDHSASMLEPFGPAPGQADQLEPKAQFEGRSIAFPESASSMPDAYPRLLYGMSSVLPAPMQNAARQEGFMLGSDARGFVLIADPTALVRFLEIGTRPSNLR